MKRQISLVHEMEFRNASESRLQLDDVFKRIARFMKSDPRRAYDLFIGTDAQVHSGHTKFITSVTIHRLGQGAWFCYRQVVIPRVIRSLQEKLTLETTFSAEVAMYFDDRKREELEDIILPFIYQGATLQVFVDIDAGTDELKNKTAAYVAEMVGRVEAMGLSARVKPEAVGASAVSNRYTKSPYRSPLIRAAT